MADSRSVTPAESIQRWINEFRHHYNIRVARDLECERFGMLGWWLTNVDKRRTVSVTCSGGSWSTGFSLAAIPDGCYDSWEEVRKVINQWLFQGLRPSSSPRYHFGRTTASTT